MVLSRNIKITKIADGLNAVSFLDQEKKYTALRGPFYSNFHELPHYRVCLAVSSQLPLLTGRAMAGLFSPLKTQMKKDCIGYFGLCSTLSIGLSHWLNAINSFA